MGFLEMSSPRLTHGEINLWIQHVRCWGEPFIPAQEVEHIVKQANELSAGLHLREALGT